MMRFIIGMLVGISLAASVLLIPQARERIVDLAAIAAGSSSGPTELQQLEEGSPVISSAPASKDISVVAAQGSDLRAAEGSTSRAAEGSTSRAAEGSFQPIWVPFRSEVSARGFATRLHRQVSTEFQVVKVAPGKYEVGFLYDSDEQLNDILRKVSNITGLESRLATRTSTGLATELPERRMAN